MSMKRLISRLKKEGRVTRHTTAAPAVTLPAEWKLPFAPSTNKLWSHVMIEGTPCRVLTKEAKDYKKQIRTIVRGSVPSDVLFTLTLTVCAVLFNKDGTPKIIDVTNRIKLIEDAIAEGLGYNDCRNWRVVLQKRHQHGPRHFIARLDRWVDETERGPSFDGPPSKA